MITRSLSNREKTLFLIIIIMIGAALLYGFVAEPIFMRWKNLDDRIKSKLAYMAKSRRLLNRYKTLEEEYINLPSPGDAMESEEREIAKTLAAIENISNSSSCRIQNVKPRASRKIGSYRAIAFEVTAEGTIGEFSRFLYEIETSKEMLRIKHFTVTSKSGYPGTLKGIFLISKIIAN